MIEKILVWDQEIFIYLNNLGIEQYDTFWSVATQIKTWIPLFILFYVLILMAYPKKEALHRSLTVLVLLFTVLLLTDTTKEFFARLRPSDSEHLKDLIRILSPAKGYSFFSGHAATSFSMTTLMVLFLRKKFSWIWILYLWPLIFSFSRIYVGVHYPSDIITGTVVGVLLAFVFYKLYHRITRRDSG